MSKISKNFTDKVSYGWCRARELNSFLILICFNLLLPSTMQSQVIETHKDIVYAVVEDKDLKLDLYIPANTDAPVLLVWLHGGAWRSGTKDHAPVVFAEQGFALASLDFRLSTEAQFPAMIHDIKAAIRFLRSIGMEYGFRTDRIAIGGISSGAHLAALVGVTNGHLELEGNVGNHLNQSSNIHAILCYYGASNLTTILAQSTPFGLKIREPALKLLLGDLPENTRELAELASPVFHIDRNDPPLLIFHGDQDIQMPINQGHELEGAYKRLGLDVQFITVYGASHGGDVFFQSDHLKHALEFLQRTTHN